MSKLDEIERLITREPLPGLPDRRDLLSLIKVARAAKDFVDDAERTDAMFDALGDALDELEAE